MNGRLFEDDLPDTIPSPFCLYLGKCPRQGRAVYGELEDCGDHFHRTVTCLYPGCASRGGQCVPKERGSA